MPSPVSLNSHWQYPHVLPSEPMVMASETYNRVQWAYRFKIIGTYANGVELPGQHSILLHSFLGGFGKVKHYDVQF